MLVAMRSEAKFRLELDGPHSEVEIQVDGERVDESVASKQLQLKPGKHHLLITGSLIKPVSQFFTVSAGDNPPLVVKLVPNTDAPGLVAPPSERRRRHDDDDDDHHRRSRDDDDHHRGGSDDD
jgi:hypothetical protein